jgi:4-hydroxy-2-oxoheptanedioate aldolase
MPAPTNTLKHRLAAGETLIGCWLSLNNGAAAEIMGSAGFDWLLIDGEHAPNDIRSIRDQLIALESSPSQAIVRVPVGETWIIKQVLDVGAQTVLVPMVESAAQARDLVRACTYPPAGTRGVGAASARASRFGAIGDYTETADAEICLLVQVENRAGMAALDDILAVEGIDGVFIGPADLAADMGFAGNSGAGAVQTAIADALGRIAVAGKAPGTLATTDAATRAFLDMGARFIAVGIDVLVLARAARALAARWKDRTTEGRT